jgi:hypothetical protein
MEPGQYQLQIFVSLIVILGAAFVALICDFLKGNNEQLRELTIELQARQEEQRRAKVPAARPTEPVKSTPVARQAVTANAVATEAEKPAETRVKRSLATPGERKRSPAREALAAMERGAQLAGVGKSAAVKLSNPPEHRQASPAAPVASIGLKPSPGEGAGQPESAPSVQPEVVMVTPEVTLVTASGLASDALTASAASPSGAKRDWGALLSKAAAAANSGTPLVEQTGSGPVTEPSLPLPAGFHDSYVLGQLVQTRRSVSGLVVSIGVNSTRKADGTNYNGVRKLIHSLIGPGDFACQSSEQEFLLIYPRDSGASAQRRLNEIAQELWNFQLGCLGTRSIVFSWGGVEVRSEMLDEAIASANERMQETRRGRKLLTMEPRTNIALRQAV